MLDKEPAVLVEKRTVKSSKSILLERQLEAIMAIPLDSIMSKNPVADVSAALRTQEQGIADIEKRLADPAVADVEVTEKITNSRRQELESELFNSERELVHHKARETALAQRIEDLRTAAVKMLKMQMEWQQIRERADELEAACQEAKNALREARAESRRYDEGPWMKRVAGPTDTGAR
jgi:hypothetical protein